MKSRSHLQRVRSMTLSSAKPILIFDFLALSIWAIWFTSYASDVWWWEVYDSIVVWVSACTYYIMTLLVLVIAPNVLVLLGGAAFIKRDLVFMKRLTINHRDAESVAHVFLGLLLASFSILSVGLVTLVMYHTPENMAWFGKFLSSPIYVFPNCLTIGTIIYIVFMSGLFLKLESEQA